MRAIYPIVSNYLTKNVKRVHNRNGNTIVMVNKGK